jgi:hypothetical protein
MVDLVPACLPSYETRRAAPVQIHTAAACCSTDSLPRTVLSASWFSGSGTQELVLDTYGSADLTTGHPLHRCCHRKRYEHEG